MAVVTMKQLLESGVHFGHQTRRWNPKMRRYIFTERSGIYIIDLLKTLEGIERSYTFVRDLTSKGGTVLFVGTKKQIADAIADEANRVGMHYVNYRWLGGMLTNFQTMYKRIRRMRELETQEAQASSRSCPRRRPSGYAGSSRSCRRTSAASATSPGAPTPSSSSTPARRRSRSRRPASSGFPSSRWSTPTAIPTSWTS